jgi:phosphoribosylanthranilate isomerase
MVHGTKLKICGLTSAADAHAAAGIGADYLGFILHPASPRYVGLEKFKALRPELPPLPKVAVMVYTTPEAMAPVLGAGFDFLQLHFPNETPFIEAAMWTDLVPSDKLWMAPRIPPGKDLDLAFIPLADHFLMDTYDPQQAGGTGRTGDWATFNDLRLKYRKVTWVLAGGLTPDNVAAAIAASGAAVIDVNSGVEASPGIKDPAKLQALQTALQGITR